MKRFFGIGLFLLVDLSFGSIKELPQSIERLFIPQGYDNNDSVQIVATGYFKNSCYQLGLTSSELSAEKKEITLNFSAYVYQGRCAEAAVPYLQVFRLGRINHAGEYQLIDGKSGKRLGMLVISKAPESGTGTDDTLYAFTSDAFFMENAGKQELVIRGIYSNSCHRVKKVEVRVQENVVIVLPYLEVEERAGCEKIEKGFEIVQKVEETLPEKFLLHVRSLGGQAINKLVLNN